MLPLHVLNAKEEIIQQRKTSGQSPINLSLKSIAGFASPIQYIRKRNSRSNACIWLQREINRLFLAFRYRPVALTAERRTPNPGVGGSNPSWPAIECIDESEKSLKLVTIVYYFRFSNCDRLMF
jgi:hypothetical protein